MQITFPYPDTYIDIPESNLMGIYRLPNVMDADDELAVVQQALERPIGTPRLREMARGKKSALIVCDDISRPTPAYKVIPAVLDELRAGGIDDAHIEFMMALGTHRPMTPAEMRAKIGEEVCKRFPVYNHEWDNPHALAYLGKTPQNVEVWVNKRVCAADLVIGVGRIMPIEVCGFTGGGKILIPGCCGEVTNNEMHWARVDLDSREVIGRRDNPVRAAIDESARRAGLNFIVNVIMSTEGKLQGCVAGDLAEAHRFGCQLARRYHEVRIPREADIVVVDGSPFDIEFWQVNKAVDVAGLVVRKGGVVICISPCHEGLSRTHADVLLEYGYRTKSEIRKLVESGAILHKVVGVHMMQVSEVAVERAKLYLVTKGISPEDVRRVGLCHAATPQEALEQAFGDLGRDANVAVLRGAAEMLPVVGE